MILSDFLGVDFTSSPLQTSPRRSPRAVNWITDRSGHNCKRGGWQQVYDLPPNADGTPRRINGMWQFDEGGRTVLLVHAGDALYRSIGAAGTDGTLTGVSRFEPVLGGESGLEDGRSQGFFFGGRLYLTGVGVYAVYGTWDGGESYRLRPVAECEDVYVPTTTVGIGPIGSDTEGGESVEAVNRLTRWRINTLVGSSTAGASYRLDGCIAGGLGSISVRVEYKDAKGEAKEVTANSLTLLNMTIYGAAYTLKNGGTEIGTIVPERNSTVLTLNAAYPPVTEDLPGITVTFKADEANGESTAAVIGGCRFGAVFGAGGNANRLVLSGNPEYPNMQYWCEIGDPTYFPDRLSSVVGSSSVPVTGMMRLSDGVLAVFKDDVGQEPTIYYQQASEDTSGVIEGGNLPLTITTVAGNVGEAVVSRAACADFYGDPLILSRNGVFGITMRANVATGDRYAVERSHFISGRLCRETLSEAAAIVYDGRYYLSVGGSCYVADAEHRATPPGGSHYQYEWWFWDNMPARVFCTFDGVLWFGTADGRICRMREGVFLDESYERFGEGQVTEGDDGVSLVFDDGLDVRVGDRIVFEYREFTDIGGFVMVRQLTGGAYPGIHVEGQIASHAVEALERGGKVYLISTRLIEGKDGAPDILPKTRFIVASAVAKAHHDGRGSIAVYWENEDGTKGEPWDSSNYYTVGTYVDNMQTHFKRDPVGDGDFNIVLDEHRDGVGFYVIDVNGESNEAMLSASPGGEACRPEERGYVDLSQGWIMHETPITTEWYTPVLDLGSAMHRKTLLRLLTVCEPGLGGRMEVGYETRRASRVVRGGESGQLDLGDLDFSDFTFDGFASSHTVRLCERRVNYVALRIRSEGAHDCRLHELRMVYRVDRECRGVE